MKRIFLILFLWLLLPRCGYAQYHSYETKNLHTIYYDENHAYIIPHLRRCFENSFKFYTGFFEYTPSEPVNVILQDFDDYGYAGATSLPFNYLMLGIEPYEYVFESAPTNERLNWVMNHELMHIVSTDKANSVDRFYRSLFFGKVTPTQENPLSIMYSYLTIPRKYAPRWYLEGIAVFMETWMAGGIGRAQSGYDEMVFRTKVVDSSYFYDFIGLESEGTTVDFQIGQNSYMYGTRFVSYLAYHYGVDKLNAWIDRSEESRRDYAAQFSHIYGTSLDEEWSKWILWENRWQQSNLDSIRQYPLTSLRSISHDALGAVSRSHYDSAGHSLFAAVNYPGRLAQIVSIDINTGKVRTLCTISTPALYYVCHLAYDPVNSLLFYTTKNNKDRRDLNILDLKTGKTERVLRSCRAGDLAFNRADGSLWGVQHHDGYSTIVRFPPPYKGWNELVRLSYGKDLFDIDVSPDGRYITGSLMEISGKQKLVRITIDEISGGSADYETLYEFGDNSPMNFVYSSDGRYLYGSTYYTGVANIVRYDFATREMEWITNCETGLFRPLPISEDSLIAFKYSGKGFIPVILADRTTTDVSSVKYLGYEISEKYPVVKTWILPSPLTINIDSLTVYEGDYHTLRNMRLISAYPVVDGYKDFAAYGVRLNVMDRLMIHDLNFTATYTPNLIVPSKERFHLLLNYSYWYWKFNASYNRSDFYDLFGPTKTSRKGYSIGVQYTRDLLYDIPKVLDYSAGLTYWGDLQRLPDYQNITVSFDRYLTGNFRMGFRHLKSSLGAVEAEAGVRAQIYTSDNYVNGKHFPRIYTTVDYGFLLPIYHSSVWMRSSFGYSFGDRDEPFANFYFGGFGNNWIDYQNAKRYRSFASFPGLDINAAGGTNFGKLLVEWALPPLRFRRFGFADLYCNWAHLTLFGSALMTNVDDEAVRSSYANAGTQVDWKLVLFSRLPSTFSFGYAFAFEKYGKPASELMVSLKILW